jgi:ubiquinone/menaquinone biosynthesis C-methylase UbiE
MREVNNINDWIEYWNTDTVFLNIMSKVAGFFLSRTRPFLNYSSDDIVLDIGCGPGDLEYLLKGEIKEIYGVDTSQRFIQECQKKFSEDSNVFFYKLDEKNYTDLSFLKNKKVSIILCLSVIQYYKSVEEVEMLIRSVKKIARTGAKFLIADIPVKHGALGDILSLLKVSLKENIFIPTLKFLFQLRFSKYYKVRSSRGLLIISAAELRQMIKRLSLNARLLKMPLTFNHGRMHLLINL